MVSFKYWLFFILWYDDANKLFAYCFLADWFFLMSFSKIFLLCTSKIFFSGLVVAQGLMTGRESRRIMSCSWFFYWMVKQNILNSPPLRCLQPPRLCSYPHKFFVFHFDIVFQFSKTVKDLPFQFQFISTRLRGTRMKTNLYSLFFPLWKCAIFSS